MQQLVSTLEETEVTITATVGERYLNEIVEGYSTARFFNSSVRVAFLGGSPQVFKPAMPFSIYVSVIIIIYYNNCSFFYLYKYFHLFLLTKYIYHLLDYSFSS